LETLLKKACPALYNLDKDSDIFQEEIVKKILDIQSTVEIPKVSITYIFII